MRIALIDPSNYITNYGLRVLASYLIQNGHDVKLIFLPEIDLRKESFYSSRVLEDLRQLIANAGLIGMSVFSNYFPVAAKLTEFLKSVVTVPIVWGGIHATVSPETSIDYADIVVIGEGEETMLELASREDVNNIPGIWYKQNGKVIKNVVRHLEENLDKYPYQCYELENSYIIRQDRIVQMTEDIFKKLCYVAPNYFNLERNENYQYLVLCSRGCPFKCTYCCNNALSNLYKGKGKYFRRRSIGNVIDELLQIRKKFPFINFFSFFDDNFLARPISQLREFAEKYKKQVGVPFKCNLHVHTATEEKLDLLVGAGLVCVEIGLESGSERTNAEIYKRPHNAEKLMAISELLNTKYRDKIKAYYDIIWDNPYETEEDISETLRFLAKLPKSINFSSFSLTFFPGTELYRRAMEDGMIQDEYTQIYRKKNNALYVENAPYVKACYTFVTRLRSSSSGVYQRLFVWLYKMVTAPGVIRFFNNHQHAASVFYKAYSVIRGVLRRISGM